LLQVVDNLKQAVGTTQLVGRLATRCEICTRAERKAAVYIWKTFFACHVLYTVVEEEEFIRTSQKYIITNFSTHY
jgi:hypothetical protein